MAGLIGPDVLSQFDVTFDYARSRIIFEKNPNYGRRDSYDRAGVWMGQSGKHFTVVDVIAGGPAQEAGVKQGDAILAIDGVSTENLVLPDVREKMRRRPVGDKVILLLESQGKQRTVASSCETWFDPFRLPGCNRRAHPLKQWQPLATRFDTSANG